LKNRLLPDLALKVVINGLLDSAWGSGHRKTIVRFFVYGDHVNIGVGEGNIKKWEIDALNASPIRHEPFEIKRLDIIQVPGIKYVPGGKISGMPQELIPVKSREIRILVNDEERFIFPAYKCFDINFGKRRILSIISPKTSVKDIVETSHPAFPKEKYRGRVENVEVKAEALRPFFERSYGIAVLRKAISIFKSENSVQGFPLLGSRDIEIILRNVKNYS